jgi:hypothetical protein
MLYRISWFSYRSYNLLLLPKARSNVEAFQKPRSQKMFSLFLGHKAHFHIY